MALKVRNAKRRLTSQPRYPTELRLDIEIDQGYPLTTAQDIALREMLADGKVTVREAADRLVALRPKPKA
ncbi:MAG TPA: hypothetical protein VJ793_18755 [Anaerolineae bacterium]|nr:hypothetical protein [Anaerolineae bacterium]